MKFFDYFEKLGFSQKDADIYLALYRLGTQPASIVAKYAGLERTYVYKSLLNLSTHNLISITEKQGIKHFFIPDISILQKYAQTEQEKYQRMGEEFHAIQAELETYRQPTESKLPKITIHDGADGVRNLYEDIYEEVVTNGYVSCKLFASNTITSQSGKADTVAQYADDFLNKMQRKKIHIETFIGNGLWLMESIGKTKNIEEMRNLPAANESIQICIAGACVYFMIFKDIPFGIKFDSEELAQTLHFLFDHLRVD